MTTGEDMLQDGKNAVDDVVEGAQNAVDDVIDGAQDAIDPNTNQNNSAGTANTTVHTPNKSKNPRRILICELCVFYFLKCHN